MKRESALALLLAAVAELPGAELEAFARVAIKLAEERRKLRPSAKGGAA